jgi:hypothetical protein
MANIKELSSVRPPLGSRFWSAARSSSPAPPRRGAAARRRPMLTFPPASAFPVPPQDRVVRYHLGVEPHLDSVYYWTAVRGIW